MEEYKKTDIGLVPHDWKLYKLGELANFRRGSFPQPYGLDKWYDDENGFPFVQVYDVGDNLTLKDTTKRRISKEAAEKSVLAEKGTLLLTIQGSIGRMAIAHYDTYVDRTLLLFNSFKVPMDKKFFMYTVYRLFELEKQRAHGSTIKTITKAQLTNFKIPLPSFSEQQKIAGILDNVDEKLKIIEQLILETIEFKKGLTQKLFSMGIGHTKFKNSKLGQIPVSWDVMNLEDITLNIKDGTHGTHKEKSNGIPLLSAKDIRGGKIFIPDNCRKISKDEFRKIHKNFSLQNEDLLLTVVGSIGRVAVVENYDKNYTFQRSVGFIRFTGNHSPYFYKQYFQTQKFLNQLLIRSNASAQAGVYLGELCKIPVISIPYHEQEKIVKVLNLVDKKIESLNIKLVQIKDFKKGLMQQLLMGKIRVKKNPIEA